MDDVIKMIEKDLIKLTKEEVNRAGELLSTGCDDVNVITKAEIVLGAWRSRHAYPINTFQSTLRDKLEHIDKFAIIAQRLKRTPSIISKLKRFHSMKLSRMQDIGGLRAVVSDINKVNVLVHNYEKSRFEHELIAKKDYIEKPKDSGYRGIHLIYKYKNKRVPQFDGLLIELQIRTKLQHEWATAVETVGTILNHSLKSSFGPKEWLDFFSLTSAAFSRLEKTKPISKYEFLSDIEIFSLVASEEKKIRVIEQLTALNFAVKAMDKKTHSGSYYLLLLNLKDKRILIRSYGQKRIDEASADYTKFEMKHKEDFQVVLVSTNSIDALKKAYPNYFMDTHGFIKTLKKVISLA